MDSPEHRFACAYHPRANGSRQRKRLKHRTLLRSEAAGPGTHSARTYTVVSNTPHAHIQPANPTEATSHAAQAPTPRGGQDSFDSRRGLPINDLAAPDSVPQTRIGSPDQISGAAGGESLREINVHTTGQEFYGPSGILTFLSRLRSKAHRAGITPSPNSNLITDGENRRSSLSLVSYMHSPDHHESNSSLDQPLPVAPSASDIAIEKECIRLYFQNLHFIHPVLDKSDFWQRCEKNVWLTRPSSSVSRSFDDRTFGPLYDAVVAVGAITAAEDDQIFNFLASRNAGGAASNNSTKASEARTLAAKYFVRAKSRLGDIFEMCSFNGTLTLLLMSVYCQNALKPHSCYMYTGMAVRAAFAIGLPMTASPGDSPASRLWWALYSVEIEMSMSAGRASALAEPSCYIASLPSTVSSLPESFISYMVPFAALLNDICRKIYNANALIHRDQKSRECLVIDQQLQQWKHELDLSWSTSSSSLTEPEWRTKQKLVCNLRFWNARILLHRPFLLYLAASSEYQVDGSHINTCVEASQATITILYDAFLVRPWFRTWWYNSTYVLYATMVVLYVLLSGIHGLEEDRLLQDGQRGLKILEAMQSNAVAARCAAVIREVLDITEALVEHRRQARLSAQVDINVPLQQESDATAIDGFGLLSDLSPWNDQLESDMGSFEYQPALWNLVDTAFLDNLLDVELARRS